MSFVKLDATRRGGRGRDPWARARTRRRYRRELAGLTVPEDRESYSRTLFGLPDASIKHMSDSTRGCHRIGLFDGDLLLAAFYVAPAPETLMRDFPVDLPEQEAPWALAGKARGDMPDPGSVVCSCFAVGRNTVKRAIASEGLTSVEQIGGNLSAGTNRGSCKSERTSIPSEALAPTDQRPSVPRPLRRPGHAARRRACHVRRVVSGLSVASFSRAASRRRCSSREPSRWSSMCAAPRDRCRAS